MKQNTLNPQSFDDKKQDRTTISSIIEEQLLYYYYLLTKRKVITGSLEDFWNTDTYTTYTLVAWESKAIEKELKELEKGKDDGKRSGNRYEVEDDPASANLYQKVTGRDTDED